MYPLGNVWTHCLRILNITSMCPLGNCPLAPSGAEGGTERGAQCRGMMGNRSLTISQRLSIPHTPQQQKAPEVPEGGMMKFFGTDI